MKVQYLLDPIKDKSHSIYSQAEEFSKRGETEIIGKISSYDNVTDLVNDVARIKETGTYSSPKCYIYSAAVLAGLAVALGSGVITLPVSLAAKTLLGYTITTNIAASLAAVSLVLAVKARLPLQLEKTCTELMEKISWQIAVHMAVKQETLDKTFLIQKYGGENHRFEIFDAIFTLAVENQEGADQARETLREKLGAYKAPLETLIRYKEVESENEHFLGDYLRFDRYVNDVSLIAFLAGIGYCKKEQIGDKSKTTTERAEHIRSNFLTSERRKAFQDDNGDRVCKLSLNLRNEPLRPENIGAYTAEMLALYPSIQQIDVGTLGKIHSRRPPILAFLSKEIGNLSNLRSLRIASQALYHLPDELGNLKQLEELDLYNNDFERFPNVISELTGLKELNIACKNIDEIPIGALDRLENLQKLTVREGCNLNGFNRCEIVTVPELDDPLPGGLGARFPNLFCIRNTEVES